MIWPDRIGHYCKWRLRLIEDLRHGMIVWRPDLLPFTPEAGEHENQDGEDFQSSEHHQPDEQQLGKGIEMSVVLRGAHGAQPRPNIVQRRGDRLSISLLSAAFPHVEVGSIVTSIIQLSTNIASTRQK